jgi:hypothetical protein
MGKRMITAFAAAALAAASAGAMVVAAPAQAGVHAAKPDSQVNRNVRRTPATLTKSLAGFTMGSGCSSVTLPITCRITEPVVNQPDTTYPFSFLPGDHVLVSGGGCVQTGGHGLTWKRYIDPASDNGLYHGLITIPSTTGNRARLLDVVGRPLVVGGRGGSLSLGYEDDGYSDNGYTAHDNGTGNQCVNSVNAWVEITIS